MLATDLENRLVRSFLTPPQVRAMECCSGLCPLRLQGLGPCFFGGARYLFWARWERKEEGGFFPFRGAGDRLTGPLLPCALCGLERNPRAAMSPNMERAPLTSRHSFPPKKLWLLSRRTDSLPLTPATKCRGLAASTGAWLGLKKPVEGVPAPYREGGRRGSTNPSSLLRGEEW